MFLAFTGAGISKDSGIETFMDRPDIREKLFRSYAQSHPEDYRATIQVMKEAIDQAEPNAAHLALAKNEVKIITMNIDGLHEKAGSKPLTLHGTMPSEEELPYCDTLYDKPVLYGDPAPNYSIAIDWVSKLTNEDTFIVVGASDHTAISYQLKMLAQSVGANIIDIQSDAITRVPALFK